MSRSTDSYVSIYLSTCTGSPYSRSSIKVWQTFYILAIYQSCYLSIYLSTCTGSPYSRSSMQVWQTFFILAQVDTWLVTVYLSCCLSIYLSTCTGRPYSRSNMQVWQTFFILAQVWQTSVFLNLIFDPGHHLSRGRGKLMVEVINITYF